MDWDDEYDNGYEEMDYSSRREESMADKSAEGGFDPKDIANPVSTYFSLAMMPRMRSAEEKKRT